MKLSLALLMAAVGFGQAADTNSWKSRTIYFALTDRVARSYNDGGGGSCGDLSKYCGGTFKGLQSKLDYIKGMGFDALWITPVVANSPNGYHGYWAQDLYSVNSNYGSAQDLKDLVNAAHGKGMYVMVDVVANHMGYANIPDDNPSPMNLAPSYHAACDIDYNNQSSIENCRIAGLPDVDTQDPNIRKFYQTWIGWLVKEYQFDGIRIDTVKHVEKDFWPDFAWASGVYSIGEVFSGDPNYLKGYAGLMAGLLNYAVYYPLNRFFQQTGSSQDLVDMHNNFGGMVPDPTTMGTFLDNHDNARFLNQHNDISSLKNALTYVMLARGIPIVYYGTEQAYAGGGDPANREDLWRSSYNTNSDMYQFLAKLGSVRKTFGGLPNNDHNHIFVEDTAYAWERADGKLLALTTNIGKGNSRQYCMYTQKNNWTWKDVFTGASYTSGGDGKMCVTVQNGEPIIMSTQ